MPFALLPAWPYVADMVGEGQSGAVRLDALSCVRGGRLLFEDVNLALSAGEAAFITGPNGVGKSSLLRIIAGLFSPVSGTVTVSGRVALANEDLALDSRATLGDALGFWAQLDGTNDVWPALEAFGIGHLFAVPVRILSTGQRKRAMLARCVASQADVWLLDEPGNGLDAASLDRLTAAMATHRECGGIIVVASHQDLDLPGAHLLELGS
jgi:heme exporter protein A